MRAQWSLPVRATAWFGVLLVALLVWPVAAQATNCSPYRTWSTGNSLTASDLNTSFSTVATTNMTPACLGDYSANATQMNTTTNPNSSGTGSLATSTAGELERLRYVLFHVFNWSQWWTHYEDVDFRHRTIRNHLTTLTGYKSLIRTEAHLSAATTRFHLVTIGLTEYVAGAAHPESMIILAHVNTTLRFGVGIGGDVHVGSTLAIHAAGTATHTAIFRPPSTGTGIWWPAVTHVALSAEGVDVVRVHVQGLMAGVNNSYDIGTTAGSRFRHLHLTGAVMLGGTANANMTVGVTVQQGTADNQVLSFKSTDVATGLTTAFGTTETNDFAIFLKRNAAAGGLDITALSENPGAAEAVININAIGGEAETSASATALGLINIYASEHDGSNALSNIPANGLVFAVRGRTGGANRSLFFVDIEGDLFVDGSTTPTAFDEWDDVALLTAYERWRGDRAAARRGIPTPHRPKRWDDRMTVYTEADLVRAKIISAPTDGGDPMVNTTNLQRLQSGVLRQQAERIERAVRALAAREAQRDAGLRGVMQRPNVTLDDILDAIEAGGN